MKNVIKSNYQTYQQIIFNWVYFMAIYYNTQKLTVDIYLGSE